MYLPVSGYHYFAFLNFVAVILLFEWLHTGGYKFSKSTFHRALFWSVAWLVASLGFAFWVYQEYGLKPSLEYITGYFVELALSVDNLFIFIVIFSFFAVPPQAQKRALTYGIVGAIIMRALFIGIGVTILNRFHWMIYLLGALLVYTALKLLKSDLSDQVKPSDNRLYKFFSRIVPSTNEYVGSSFFTKRGHKWIATPLFFVVIVIESTDLMFAVDSIPAIFGITKDPFIVFTSNVFAIICLRSLYAVVSHALVKIKFLNYGLAFILGFIGIEMLMSWYIHIPIQISLTVVLTTFLVTYIASSLSKRRKAAH